MSGRRKMMCPDQPKGQRCTVCGGSYVCLKSKLPKAPAPAPKTITKTEAISLCDAIHNALERANR